VRSNWRSAAQVRRVKGGLLRLRVNSWALLSEVLELGRWRVFARLPPVWFFALGRTREIPQLNGEMNRLRKSITERSSPLTLGDSIT
jgi:hypothetical protein